MGDGIYAALSGAIAHQTSLETTATNLANASTTGFRAIQPVFREILAEQGGPGQATHFSAVRKSAIDTTLGGLKQTDRELDIALPREVFLAVQTQAGERYTRAGSLEVNPGGTLATRNGHVVMNEAQQPIRVDPNANVLITPDGEVIANGESLGFLRLVSFNDPRQMSFEGKGLLAAAAEAGAATASTEQVEVGKLEKSNFSPVRAVTDLMMASRMFSAMERAISTFRSIDRRMVTTVPK